MEDLIKLQKQSADEFERMYSNFKKDSKIRKTAQYLNQKLELLEAAWREFDQRHTDIEQLAGENIDHPYFQKNFYEQVKAVCEKYREGIQTSRQEENVKEDSEQSLRFKKQKTLSQALLRLIDNIEEQRGQQHSRAYYQLKMRALSDYWATITEIHNDIMTFASPIDYEREYVKNHLYEDLEDTYHNTMIYLQECCDELAMHERPQKQKIKLPAIEVPNFNGNYHNWKSFHDLFVEVIHNNDALGNAQKLQYLKANLSGEPSKLLKHLHVTDNNYETAWELLNHRYNNTRLLVSTQLTTLLSQNVLAVETASGIKKLHDTTKECLLAIKNLGVETEGWDPIIVHIITQKLDKESQKLYEQGLKAPRDVQTLEELFTFLENRFQALEAMGERHKKESHGGTSFSKNQKRETVIKGYHGALKQKCPACEEEHEIYKCKKFIEMAPKDRRQIIKREKLCINCLKRGHNEHNCKSLSKCKMCQRKHNTLVHIEATPQLKPKECTRSTFVGTQEQQETIKQEENLVQYQSHIAKESIQILLATAMIKVINQKGQAELLRALIDQGSQVSFIKEDVAQRLGLPRTKVYAKIGGLGGTSAGISKSSVQLTILPRFSSTFQMNTTALVLPNLTKILPAEKIQGKIISQVQTLLLADPNFDRPGPIDIILGADVFGEFILDGVIKGNPVAQKTEFGWILSGSIIDKKLPKETIQVNCLVAQSEVETQLRKFWEIEEIPAKHEYSQDEMECEEFYEKTVTRSQNGRYTVRIPFNPKKEQPLGSSKEKALARLFQMERKFIINKEFGEAYRNFMEEYIQLGHMVPVEPIYEQLDSKQVYYIPHHAVINQNSSTTKLRVVFDASAKTSTGISLNEKTFNGPTLQQNLMDILLRWRRHRIVITSDVEKMYRQIKVAKEDQNYQRILWRKNPHEPIKEYQLTTVTYGTRSAPYLAIKTLRKLAHDDKAKYPEAAEVTLKDFYVDDLITGCDTIEEALKLKNQLTNLLKGGGFKLRKWASNNPELIENLPEEDRNASVIQFEMSNLIKTLGIYWNPTIDCFQFKVSITPSDIPITKRKFLSEASKLFDPLGWLSPAIIQIKIAFQELWLKGLTWDQKLPENVERKWKKFKRELPKLDAIKIPRWIEYDKTAKCELHGFCDASEKAYAAVLYAKVITTDGKITISLLTAKTKVAPISKPLSLPRLELCGALLLARLVRQVQTVMELENIETFAYTDSTIVLSWLRSHPSKWKTFVANRVGEIQSILNTQTWHHIKSNMNPADCASRGLSPDNLIHHSLWWEGPQFLKEKFREVRDYTEFKTDLEARKISSHAAVLDREDLTYLLTKFSNFLKLIRVIAWCFRFILKCRKKSETNGPLTVKELEAAKILVLKLAQRQEFLQDIKRLMKGKQVNKDSKLSRLNPFLDQNGLLRVGGRLHNAELTEEAKHQVILPYKGPLTTLIIEFAHQKTLHGGIELTLAHLRNEFWIIKGYSAVKQHLHKCLKCFRFRKTATNQIMGVLPKPRVTISRPFTNTGIDYAGPLNIKATKGRSNITYKGYICIFICLATKAIHLEIVSDLTAQAFLAAFKRFTGRRGNVANIYSDNGTNFVLANKLLQSDAKCYAGKFNKEVFGELANMGTQWHFIPPASPHFGGLWEAGVKSIKYHMKRIIGDHNLTYEELQTVLIQIESCLNSRPLCPLTDDSDSLEVLTPGHFLIGSAITAPAAKDYLDENMHSLRRWQLLERLHQTFWKRWSNEYLTRLQQRPKWTHTKENIKVGQLILLKDEQLPPTRWALGRILETQPGPDGLTRVVTIQTKNNTLKRPITKICLLPISDNQPQEDERIQLNSMITQVEQGLPSNRKEPWPRQEQGIPSNRKEPWPRQEQATLSNREAQWPGQEKAIPSNKREQWPGQKRKADYARLIEHELKIAKKERAQRNPKRIRIRPVTGYPNLVPRDLQEKAREEYKQRYRLKTVKRPHTDKSEQPAKLTRHDTSFTLFHGTILCLLLLLFFKIGKIAAEKISRERQYDIIPFTSQPGIFFEEMGEVKMETNEWKLIVYVDMSNYWTELTSLQKRIRRLSLFCNTTNIEYIEKNGCSAVITQLRHELTKAEHNNNILYQHNGDLPLRQKRSPLNIVGQIANKLFGILDEDFAEHYEEQIQRVKENENHLLNLLKNQTSIQEVTSNIIKRTREELVQHIEEVEQQVQNLLVTTSNVTANHKKMEAFLLLVSHTMFALSSYQHMQNALLNMVINTQSGRISPLVLTPDQLQQQLTLIRGNLPENVVLPSDGKENPVLEIYKLMSAKSRITKRNIIFDVTIPLFSSSHFQLFHIIPVPTPHKHYFAFIKPSTDYLIVNLHRDQYYPITNMELKGCTATSDSEFICKQQHPIYNLQSNLSRCEINLLRQERISSTYCNIYQTPPAKLWLPLHSPNNWIFIMDEECMINIICGKIVANIALHGSGILRLQPKCVLNQLHATISSRYTYTGQVRTSFTPSTNLSDYLDVTSNTLEQPLEGPIMPKRIYDDSDIAALDHAINQQKQQEKLPKNIDKHDIHQYSLIYLVLVIIVAAGSYKVLRKLKRNKRKITVHKKAGGRTPANASTIMIPAPALTTATTIKSPSTIPTPAPRTSNLRDEDFVLHYSTAGEHVG